MTGVHNKQLIDAWNRFVDNDFTDEDLDLIRDSFNEDKILPEFHAVSDRVWNETINDTPKSKEWIEVYRKEAAQIVAEYEYQKMIQSQHVLSRTIRRFRKIWYAAAAVLLLGLLIPAAYFYLKPKTEQTESTVQYVEAVTRRGEIKTLVLPDQTKVTLNAESSLKYPSAFTGERSVELQGEAIFDVTHDSHRPFTVATTEMKIKVLGTIFNVKSYTDDELSMVSVASGKVAVETWRAASGASTILLEKDRQLKINKTTGKHEKLTINADQYLSWTNGILYFNETPIREVVNMLNRSNSQMVFELAEGEYPNLISGTLNTKKLEALLEPIIRSFKLSYKKTGNKILLYK